MIPHLNGSSLHAEISTEYSTTNNAVNRGMELAKGGAVTKGATPSSFRYTDKFKM